MPHDVSPLFNQAVESYRHGAFAAAESLCLQVLKQRPEQPDGLHLLGTLRGQQGFGEQAIELVQRAIRANPQAAHFRNSLAVWLAGAGRYDEAVESWHEALRLQPDYAEAWYNIGNARLDQRCWSESIEALRAAIQLEPKHANAWNNLGWVLQHLGRIEEAVDCFRRSVALSPGQPRHHSSLAYALWLHPEASMEMIAQEHRAWGRQFAPRQPARAYPHDRSPEHRLRIGFVSADLRDHPVGRHLLPFLRECDRERFETVCYSDCPQPDETTQRLRKQSGVWRESGDHTDAQLAEQIERDGIDILVDLALHSIPNRLLAFDLEPAPVQVCFAGYPGITGVEGIRYRLTDRFLDPVGLNEVFYTEESIRLPDSYWCFDPFEDAPAVNERPFGPVTFGCLNQFARINGQVLDLWCRVLQAIPESRLLLQYPSREVYVEAIAYFEKAGVAGSRLLFAEVQPRAQYFAQYHEIDVILDTFPYNGHTTSIEALWMGVPVVSLCGQTPVSRGGLSILSQVGLADMVATTDDEFIHIATALVTDRARLTELRHSLRDRLKTSPLMDTRRFTRGLEDTFRTMWKRWC